MKEWSHVEVSFSESLGSADSLLAVAPLQLVQIGAKSPLGPQIAVPYKGAPVAPSMIPIDSYAALERQVQNLQIAILAEASKSSGPVTIEAIRRAIRWTLENFSSQTKGPKRIRKPEPAAYKYLEGRLDNLRGLVSWLAETVARETQAEVTPELIQSCWTKVSEDLSQMNRLLDPDFTLNQPANEQESDPELVPVTVAQDS